MELLSEKWRGWEKLIRVLAPILRRDVLLAPIHNRTAQRVDYLFCNLLLSIARFPEGDPAILKGEGGEASIEISTRDIIKIRD